MTAVAGYPTPLDQRTHTITLGALPPAVQLARDLVRIALRQWELSDLTDDAVLIMSELVTNAIKASPPGATVTARIHLQGDVPVIDVQDGSEHGPRFGNVDPLAESGRGLFVVHALSQSLAVFPAPGSRPQGKVVRAIMRAP